MRRHLLKVILLLWIFLFIFTAGSTTPAQGGVFHPSNMTADYLYAIGETYYKQGNYFEALHEFKKVLLIKPGYKNAREYVDFIEAELQLCYSAGETYYKQGDYLQALYEFKKVLLIEPGHKDAREYVDFIEVELRIRKEIPPRLPEAIEEDEEVEEVEEIEEIKPLEEEAEKVMPKVEIEPLKKKAKEVERLTIEQMKEQAIVEALGQAKKLMGAGVPEPIPPKEILPKEKTEVTLEEKKTEPKKPYEELRIGVERAGFERYYVQGEGFRAADFLGLAASAEVYEEPKKIDDMVLITGQDFEGFEGYTKDDLRKMTHTLFTRSFAGQAILRYKDLPRFKYTYEEKDALTEYRNKDVDTWETREYDLLYSFPLFGRAGFLTLNPIYKDIVIFNERVATKFENVDQYHLNYSIRPLDTLEIFAQQHYETNKNLRSSDPSKNKTRYFRFELRKTFPEQKFRITPGWYHGETKWMPGDTLQVKDEMYLDMGKDFTGKWRDALRLEYDIDELRRVANSHIKSDVFRLENKLSYNLFGGLDISLGLDYGADLSSLSRFDNLSFYGELEYVKFGFLRWKAGYRHTEYLELSQGLDAVYVKTYLFRF